MPETQTHFYCDDDGSASVLEWLTRLARKQPGAVDKCRVRIETLRQMGHDLRRPIADYVDGGIHELRTRHGTVKCRILYFFHGKNVAIWHMD